MAADRKQRRRDEDGKILQAHGHRFRKMTQNVVVDATMGSMSEDLRRSLLSA